MVTDKQCSVCNQVKPLEEYNVQSTGKHGRRADCKECKKRFIRTKEGLVNKIYSMQKRKSTKRGYQQPNYTKAELLDWLLNNKEFNQCYDNWVANDYLHSLVPSVDRINDFISYRLDNIRVLPWGEHNKQSTLDRKTGKNTKVAKAVDQLTKDGQFIKRHHSIKAAARELNDSMSNIKGAIVNRVTVRREPDGSTRTYIKRYSKGYRWRWSDIPNDNSEIIL